MRHTALLALVLAGLAALTASPAAARATAPSPGAPVSLVDTRDGSLGAGFPQVGAGLPFGMISPGPDTSLPDASQDPVDYVGYSYQDPDIRGFSLTHFDGAGVQIAGDLPFMPITGQPASSPLGNASPFEHATEMAQPGYYAVTLARYGIRAELTATTRAAMMRFTYPAAGPRAGLLAEVTRGINGTHSGAVTVTDNHTLTGWVKSDVGYTVHFVASFDHSFTTSAPLSGGGEYLAFDTSKRRTVTMRVAISYIDQTGAEHNLTRELPARRSFASVRQAAQTDWARHLDDVRISGGLLPDRETFYDNLYRSLLLPTVFDDADGRYLGFDGQVHTVAPGTHHYTNLSLWDTYRSQMPLLELIEPRVAHDILTSLIDDADQNHGVIPRWVQANIDRGIMAGDSGSAILADGAAAGLLTHDEASHALDLLRTQATTLPPVWPREHLDALTRYGYIPNDIDAIGTSLTLEYGIDDTAVAALASALGDTATASMLSARAGDWRHLVDPSTRFIRPRNSNGSWATPTAGRIYNPIFQDGYQEGTGWQYLWSVPEDPAGLAQAIGGTGTAIQRLDQFFSTALNSPVAPVVPRAQQYTSFFGVYYIGNQYTPANEPDLWTPWFYDWYGQPWNAQKVARAEMSAYDSTPEGMPGNDDAGEMSAWYVLAALGIYHAAPGVDAWELSSPAFPRTDVRTGTRTLRIEAPGASAAAPYVQALSLNGAPVNRTYLTTCQLLGGGALRYTLGASADEAWGTGGPPPSASHPATDVEDCAARLTG
ncbi:MAG TPA: GH92 family glycosyl hydrolase [Thermomicrobiaceae bacterium]|nr:GH92 family glycosyl hydrolase [Thermomicrobiaceae bacterium]